MPLLMYYIDVSSYNFEPVFLFAFLVTAFSISLLEFFHNIQWYWLLDHKTER